MRTTATRSGTLLLEDEGRHAHRRIAVADVAATISLRHARRLFRVADAATGESRFGTRRPRLQPQDFITSAPIRRQPHHRRHGQRFSIRPGYLMSCSIPENGCAQQWRSTRCRYNPAIRLETWEEPRRGAPRRRPPLASARRLRSRVASLHSSAPAIRRPPYTSLPRGDGMENLFTCAIVALNVDTGKIDVLPDVAARHARLGLGADGRCSSTAISAQRPAQRWC